MQQISGDTCDLFFDTCVICVFSTSNLYVVALYWSLVTFTTLGYGDIVPQNLIEMGFAIFIVFLGMCPSFSRVCVARVLGGLSYPAVVGAVANIMNTLDYSKVYN